jgi:hypothetical protein
MAATPSLKHVSATRSSSDILFQTLIENTGAQGMVRLRTFNKDTGICVEEVTMASEDCLPVTQNNYINGVYYRMITHKAAASLFSTGCLRIYSCNSGDDCDTISCAAWNTAPASIKDAVVVGADLGVTPSPVSGFGLVPGDRSIIASWRPPTDAPIFAYEITLKDGLSTFPIVSGYIVSENTTITNLINGKTYKVTIAALSDDGRKGPSTTLNAIPGATCVNPSCTIKMI